MRQRWCKNEKTIRPNAIRSQTVIAVILAILGALVATDAWVERVRAVGAGQWVGGATIWIILGAVFVAVSSVISTLGWNGLSDWQQSVEKVEQTKEDRAETLKAVVAEIIANRKRLANPSFLESDPKKLQQHAYYPRLPKIALENAFTSGLFIGEDDRPLFSAIFQVHDRLTVLNSLVARTEGSQISTVVAVRNTRDELREHRDAALVEFSQFVNLLTDKYEIDPEEKFFVDWQITKQSTGAPPKDTQ